MIDLRTNSIWTQPWNYGVRHMVVAWEGELQGRIVVWYERIFHFVGGIANFFFPLNYLIAIIEKAIYERMYPAPLPDPSDHSLSLKRVTTPPPQPPQSPSAASEADKDYEKVTSDPLPPNE